MPPKAIGVWIRLRSRLAHTTLNIFVPVVAVHDVITFAALLVMSFAPLRERNKNALIIHAILRRIPVACMLVSLGSTLGLKPNTYMHLR